MAIIGGNNPWSIATMADTEPLCKQCAFNAANVGDQTPGRQGKAYCTRTCKNLKMDNGEPTNQALESLADGGKACGFESIGAS